MGVVIVVIDAAVLVPRKNMKLNERSLVQFAISSVPSDKQGYLNKKGELNRGYQRRWFVLKGNLFYYFEREGDKEAIGVVILENCHVELAESEDQPYAFQISYGGQGARTYILGANSSKEMESWMKALTNASYTCLKMMVEDLERRLNDLTAAQKYNSAVNITAPLASKSATERVSNITEDPLLFTSLTTSNKSPSNNLGKFEPSTSVAALIELDAACDSDFFSAQKCPDELLPLNFNEFQHLQALHGQGFDNYRSKSLVYHDECSIQKMSSGLGRSSRSKSERRRNYTGTHTVPQTGQFQTYTKSFVDENYDITEQQVSTFKYLHNMYGASIWVKAKECGKNTLL